MKTKFNKIAALIAALCTLLLVVSGCNLFGPELPETNKGTGNITLSINGAGIIRTIFPKDVEFDSYNVAIYNAANDDLVYDETWTNKISDTIPLQVGSNYRIEVEAYIDDILAAQGETIINGLTTAGATANVLLLPLAAGEGTFSWNITLHDSIESAEINITGENISGTTSIVLKGTGATTLTSVPLGKGSYSVVIALDYGNNSFVNIPEDLIIYAGMTSHYERTIGSYSVVTLTEYILNAVENGFLNNLTEALFTDSEIGITFGAPGTYNFADIRGQFAGLITADGAPSDLTELKALVDAALVKEGLAASYASQDDAEAAVDSLIRNQTTPGFTLAGNNLSITIGIYNINVTVIPPITSFDVLVAGNVKTAFAITANGGGTVNFLNDESGYEFVYAESGENVNYGNAYVAFALDFTGDALKNYKEISFTFRGLSGDIAWKQMAVLASNSPITGWRGWGSEGNSAHMLISSAQGTSYDGLSDKVFTYPIDPLLPPAALTGNTLYFVILFDAPNILDDVTTSYRISDISFVLGEICDECLDYPCTCTFDTVEQTVIVSTVGGGTLTIFDDDTGYTFGLNGGYGSSYAKFQVDLGTGNTLSDFEKVSLTYQGVSGDVGWKTLHLMASSTEPTASVNNENNPGNPSYLDLSVAQIAYSNNGLTAANFDFVIDPVKAAAITTQNVWFAVYFHGAATGDQPTAGLPTIFSVSDVEFVGKGTKDNIELKFEEAPISYPLGPNPHPWTQGQRPSSDVYSEDTSVPGTLTIHYPGFSGFGGVGGTNVTTFNFHALYEYGAAISYAFPSGVNASTYTDIAVHYTVTKITTTGYPLRPMKFTIANALHNSFSGGFSYPQHDSNDSYVWNGALSSFGTNSMVIQHNLWVDTAGGQTLETHGPADFVIQITKIEFTGGALPIVIGDWSWLRFDDSHADGTSTINLTQGEGAFVNRITAAGTVTDIDVNNGGYVNWDAIPNAATLEDLKTAGVISFNVIGDGRDYIFKIITSGITDARFYQTVFRAPVGENTIYIPVADLRQPNWGTGFTDVPFNQNDSFCIQFSTVGNPRPYDFVLTVWDIDFHAPPKSVTGNMGLYQYGSTEIMGSANLQQATWILSGTTLDSFKAADQLVIQLGETPTANLQLAWQPKSTEGDWYTGWNGTDIRNAGVYQNGASFASGTLTIDLATAIANYADFLTQPDVKIIFAHYDGGNINDLDITSANHVVVDKGDAGVTIQTVFTQNSGLAVNSSATVATDGNLVLSIADNNNYGSHTPVYTYQWRINGVTQSGFTGSSANIPVAGLGLIAGNTYTGTAIITIDGVYFSQVFTFTVQ